MPRTTLSVTNDRPYTSTPVQVYIPSADPGQSGRWAVAFRRLAGFYPHAEGVGQPGEGSSYFTLDESGEQVLCHVYREIFD